MYTVYSCISDIKKKINLNIGHLIQSWDSHFIGPVMRNTAIIRSKNHNVCFSAILLYCRKSFSVCFMAEYRVATNLVFQFPFTNFVNSFIAAILCISLLKMKIHSFKKNCLPQIQKHVVREGIDLLNFFI